MGLGLLLLVVCICVCMVMAEQSVGDIDRCFSYVSPNIYPSTVSGPTDVSFYLHDKDNIALTDLDDTSLFASWGGERVACVQDQQEKNRFTATFPSDQYPQTL
ncbi:hypothetical protein KIPB_014041, partial [Kipferlia bialata]|eukprot:g14041.t1